MRSGFDVAIVVGQCGSCLVLAGLALVVQLVVYPGFATVGRAAPAAWAVVHEQHNRRIAQAVGPPWLIEAVAWAIPLHARIAESYDEPAVRALLWANGLRLALWAAAGGLSVAMLLEV